MIATLAGPAFAAGHLNWANRYNGPGNGIDGARAIAVSPDGSTVFVTGHSAGAGGVLDYAAEAINASDGRRLWVARYHGPGVGDAKACCIAVSPDGSTVFVSGQSPGATSGLDYATQALTATTGKVEWTRRYNGPGNGEDTPSSLVLSPDGNHVYVTGTSDGGASTGMDYATQAITASTGAVQWARRYNGPAHGSDAASSLAVSPDGMSVYVTGSSDGGASTGMDYATQAIAASGTVEWAKRYNGLASGDDHAVSVKASLDGAEIVVFGTAATPTGDNIATLAYTTDTGAKIWAKATRAESGGLEATAMAIGSTQVWVTFTGPEINDAVAANAYDPATGSRVAGKLINGSKVVGRALAISPDGSKVFESGEISVGTNGINYDTNEFRPGGGVIAQDEYNGPVAGGYDGAFAVAVSPDGKTVYVTGDSAGVGSGLDYATVAYET